MTKVSKLAARIDIRLLGGFALLWVAATMSGTAWAGCGDLVGDFDDLATVRAQIQAQCDCEGAESRRTYLRCARDIARAAVDAGNLSRSCRRSVLRCARKSTCGRPAGFVTCCRTRANGATRCAVKRDAAHCRAPRNGTACVGHFASCCDSCTNGGCIVPTPTPTRTITPTPTETPTPTFPPICETVAGLPAIGQVPFTIDPGTTDCGGLQLSPGPQPPFSGQVDDASGTKLSDLGLGCLHTGTLPPVSIPDGSTSILDVVGINGLALTLAASDGSGPSDCTKGAGPERHCINGASGTDGSGACTSDSDCPGIFFKGACALDPHCFFGPPLPIPDGAVPVCVVNVFASDMCGQADLAGNTTTLTTQLSARVYKKPSGAPGACPVCIAGACSGGKSDGEACTTVSSTGTSVDCLPDDTEFFATILVNLPELTTATSVLGDTDAFPCPGQTFPGLFGLTFGTRVTQTGSPLGGIPDPSAMSIAAAFCVPKTGNASLDTAAGLPGPGALSVTGTMDTSGVIGLPLP